MKIPFVRTWLHNTRGNDPPKDHVHIKLILEYLLDNLIREIKSSSNIFIFFSINNLRCALVMDFRISHYPLL